MSSKKKTYRRTGHTGITGDSRKILINLRTAAERKLNERSNSHA